MTTQPARDSVEQFNWTPQPQAEKFVIELLAYFLDSNTFAMILAERMKLETGTRFRDWVEAIVVPDSHATRDKLTSAGYVPVESGVFGQPQGIFPRIVLHDQPHTAVHLKVQHVADFAGALKVLKKIDGEVLNPYRRVRASAEKETELWAAERWGWMGFDIPAKDSSRDTEVTRALEAFGARRREFDDDAQGYEHTTRLIDSIGLDVDHKCALFFAAERDYWQKRNRAARVQRARQDRLGLGWGNHDHHTYRCSRENFARHVAFMEKLGFHCRERFYAGREAGWGAQVMEQPNAGIVTFNDVDLSPDELMGDFSHAGLQPRDRLGTVGLWCGLHGDSFLQAGMHHLEAQFDFDAVREQLARDESVKTMPPFTNFTYLRQAFTEGEHWQVSPARIARLLEAKLITPQQAKQFSEQGAIGSHLENLERNEGFKGFNQTGVSEIIAATDPRKHLPIGA